MTIMNQKYMLLQFALVLIKTSKISEPFSTDWLKDRLNIQIGKFGIEVTEAIGKREGEQRQLDSNILRCETYENANKYISNLKYTKKYHSETKQLQGSERFSLTSSGVYNDKVFNDLIVNRIYDKSSKFLKYPDCKQFSRRGLYISDQ